MSNRFSMNGDGKKTVPTSDREKQLIDALTGRYKVIEELWEHAEQDLKQFRIPHDVHHCYKSEQVDEFHNPELTVSEYLGFVHYGRGWRICHSYLYDGHNGPPEEFNWKPITESTVDVRIEAISHFENLRRMVIEAAENCVPKLDDAISDFRKILTRS